MNWYGWRIGAVWLAMLFFAAAPMWTTVVEPTEPLATLLAHPERIGFDGLSDF